MRLSKNYVLSSVSWVYIWFFRGTPVYVQILLWGNFGILYPRSSLACRSPDSCSARRTANVIVRFVAAILALGLNEAAYAAEMVRAGIISVDGARPRRRNPWACPRAHHAPRRPAAGHAGDHPAHGQRDHLDAQDDLPGGGHPGGIELMTNCRSSTRRTSRSCRC